MPIPPRNFDESMVDFALKVRVYLWEQQTRLSSNAQRVRGRGGDRDVKKLNPLVHTTPPWKPALSLVAYVVVGLAAPGTDRHIACTKGRSTGNIVVANERPTLSTTK